MAFLDYFRRGETRSATQTASIADGVQWVSLFGDQSSNSGETVTEETALGVPAFWQAVNAIAGTISHLPLHLYKVTGDAKEKAKSDPLYRIVHDQPNRIHTKPAFFKWVVSRLQTDGRAVALIVRKKNGQIASLLPLQLADLRITQSVVDGELRRTYRYRENIMYLDSDVLDFVLSYKSNGYDHYNPIYTNRHALGLIIAAERYASTLFASGGVPPLQLSGKQGSPQARERANNDINSAIANARHDKRAILHIPENFELKPIGFEPAKQQMIELRKFQISEVSRICNIAPAMLHDLSGGTYSNVEQQNLNFASQTIAPIIKILEAEMNSKLFGAKSASFVEFDMGGLLRGDFATRMAGMSSGVQNGVMTPNEARALDNRPPLEGGDQLFIQGATVPLAQAGQTDATSE